MRRLEAQDQPVARGRGGIEPDLRQQSLPEIFDFDRVGTLPLGCGQDGSQRVFLKMPVDFSRMMRRKEPLYERPAGGRQRSHRFEFSETDDGARVKSFMEQSRVEPAVVFPIHRHKIAGALDATTDDVGTVAVVRSPDFFCARPKKATALATWTRQRRLTPSCGGHASDELELSRRRSGTRRKLQSDAVHAIAQSSGGWAVLEHVSKMTATAATMHFRARHKKGMIIFGFNRA